MLRQLVIAVVLSCFIQQAQAARVGGTHQKKLSRKRAVGKPRKAKKMKIYGIRS
jgi:hypothetical protein